MLHRQYIILTSTVSHRGQQIRQKLDLSRGMHLRYAGLFVTSSYLWQLLPNETVRLQSWSPWAIV